MLPFLSSFFFFLNEPATPKIYPLPLHAPLPIYFVLSVGRLDRAKRHELLLEALAADSTLRCVIVGDGPDRERLEEVARRRGLDGRARLPRAEIGRAHV